MIAGVAWWARCGLCLLPGRLALSGDPARPNTRCVRGSFPLLHYDGRYVLTVRVCAAAVVVALLSLFVCRARLVASARVGGGGERADGAMSLRRERGVREGHSEAQERLKGAPTLKTRRFVYSLSQHDEHKRQRGKERKRERERERERERQRDRERERERERERVVGYGEHTHPHHRHTKQE